MDPETAGEFLQDWLEENVDEAALEPGDVAAACVLAQRCLQDALDEGVGGALLVEVAGGDLPARILAVRDALAEQG